MRRQAPELRKKIVHPIFSSSDGKQVHSERQIFLLLDNVREIAHI